MPLGPQQLDGPPPSPVTDPAAASASSRLGMLTGGAAPGQPGGPSGGPRASGQPDLSGVMALGQKVQEAILALAQMLPAQAGPLNQAMELIVNATAQAAQNNPGEGGGKPPVGAVAQAGPQFAGGGFSSGRPS